MQHVRLLAVLRGSEHGAGISAFFSCWPMIPWIWPCTSVTFDQTEGVGAPELVEPLLWKEAESERGSSSIPEQPRSRGNVRKESVTYNAARKEHQSERGSSIMIDTAAETEPQCVLSNAARKKHQSKRVLLAHD